MNYDFLTTTLLLDAVEQIPPLKTFLRDRYFPTGAGDIFSTQSVLVEYKDGSNTVAPFVVPRKGGVNVTRQGFEVKEFKPANIAPRRVLTLDDLEKRGFGEALYPKLTPRQRALAITTKDMQELSDMITRREEQMCAEVMQNNSLNMTYIADDKDAGEEVTLKFYSELKNPAEYTPSANWTTESTTILGDIGAMTSLLATRGLGATDLIVGTDVAEILINNTTIKDLLNNRRYELGSVAPIELPSGASRLMVLNHNGRVYNVFCYEGEYTDFATGETKPFIDPKNVILTAPGAGRTAYGAVTQMEYPGTEFETHTGTRIPKYDVDQKDNMRMVTVTSKPLVMPKAKNPFIVAKVVE